ncbi:MAG: putative zinc-binding alcohol dehydrogenase [Chroococcidiopsis sp. SAG 2025]|nr:zinc-binding dehydrogenase [Chroococcidiopsis sp. SAG 2025]MDV2996814.1 putative zinc-binding alcohol dehydrogenase [Chroococcidiopsis sp. SAG 2025]
MQEITQGGAESVLECVGSEPAMATAIGIARPGGVSGYVDVPHGSSHNLNLGRLFMQNITLRGGAAPARAYIPELLADTVAGKLNASAVLDLTVDLSGVPKGYAAMDSREVIKVMVRP